MLSEYENNIRKSIKALSNLLDKGTKFYPSSEVDDNIKQAFPEQPNRY